MVSFKKYTITFLLVIFTISLNNLFAFKSGRLIEADNKDDTVKVANRIGIEKDKIALTVSVIDSNDIERRISNSPLSLLSQKIPGLFVTRKNIVGYGILQGSAGDVNIRGIGQSSRVLIMVDGHPQWNGLYGFSIADLYNYSNIDRIEVIRGAGSLLYGTNAMGGVINIITKSHFKEGRESKAEIMYGSYNTQMYSFSNSYRRGKLSAFVAANYDAGDGHRTNSHFNNTNAFLKVDYKINEYFNIKSNISFSKIYYENPGKKDDPVSDNKMNMLKGAASIIFENTHRYGSGAIHIFENLGRDKINEGYKIGELPKKYLFNSNDHYSGIMVYENIRLFKGNNFLLGFDYKNWGGRAWNAPFNSENIVTLVDKVINEGAGYFTVQQQFFDKLSLDGGLRFEYNSKFLGTWIPRIGLTFKAFKNNVIKGSISKGYRNPTIREMYMNTGQNSDLLPENLMSFDVSVGHSFLESRLYSEFTFFYVDSWNMIETVRINGIPKYLNTGIFVSKGIEINANYALYNNLKMDFNYSYLSTNKIITGAPKHKLSYSCQYVLNRYEFTANAQYIAGLYLNSATKLKESYALLNAKASYRYTLKGADLRFYITGENLTGTKYTIIEGFQMPGVQLFAGVEISF